ncbi:hypothetical protein BOX24_08380 [Leptospirillum ferriphilum]|jgi:hypothetical protein|nr:hypothetical protein ABH19_12965 [Leptospirillum sp. Group II 'CF-1']OOH71525.1 hypothetical protein BOX24_08380 [Leptospirillum ferriphilum]
MMMFVLRACFLFFFVFWPSVFFPSASFAADPLSERDNYQTLKIPVAEYGFRGVGKDGRGQIYLTSLLKNGIYVLPPSCLKQDCATFLRMRSPLSDPGQVVGLPRGGAIVLLRLADRLIYIPFGCYSSGCLRTIVLPRTPSYPSSGVVDPVTHTVWVTEQLADQVSKIPSGCFRTSCMKSINLPVKGAAPSGMTVIPGKGLWVTEKNRDRLAFIPDACEKTSCIQEVPVPFHSQSEKLHPFSPVFIGDGKIAFLLKRGRIVSVMKTGSRGISFVFLEMERGIGRAASIVADKKGNLILLAKGSRLHVGKIRLSKNCLHEDGNSLSACTEIKVLPISGGSPTGLAEGRHGEYWMTLRNSDQVILFRLNSSHCFGEYPEIRARCYQTIAFRRGETLYHREYHQEVSH